LGGKLRHTAATSGKRETQKKEKTNKTLKQRPGVTKKKKV